MPADITPVDQLDTRAERNGVLEERVVQAKPKQADGLLYDQGKIMVAQVVDAPKAGEPQQNPDGLRYDWGQILKKDAAEPQEESAPPEEKEDPNRSYAILGGLTHVFGGSAYIDHNGKERDYADHGESLKVQQFFADTKYADFSYVIGTNYNNYLNGKSTLFSLCSEFGRYGMCAGVEHGLEGDIPDDKLINGSLAPKYDAYRTWDIEGGLWGLFEKGTQLKTGVESVIKPDGKTSPMLNVEIRYLLDPPKFNF